MLILVSVPMRTELRVHRGPDQECVTNEILFFLFVASDYTLYPFSTTNPVDYQNLRNVYMDAAFFPHLRELDFKQEGWRLEHENPNGINSCHIRVMDSNVDMREVQSTNS